MRGKILVFVRETNELPTIPKLSGRSLSIILSILSIVLSIKSMDRTMDKMDRKIDWMDEWYLPHPLIPISSALCLLLVPILWRKVEQIKMRSP